MIKVFDILFHIGAWLINFIEQDHLLLDQVHHLVNMPPVPVDPLFLLLQDLLDQVLVVGAKTVRVVAVLAL